VQWVDFAALEVLPVIFVIIPCSYSIHLNVYPPTIFDESASQTVLAYASRDPKYVYYTSLHPPMNLRESPLWNQGSSFEIFK
jgi:hypothetical protein